jgi:hypothetical protein
MFTPRFLAAALMVTMIPIALPGNPVSLGIVTQASDANLGTGVASEGATVFDGDRLSTDEDGALTFRGGSNMLYLARGSRVTLHSLPNVVSGARVDLTSGTLVFTASRPAGFQLNANGAVVRPIADSPTIGQVTVIDPKTLYIYARQGSLCFFYEDETEIIPEGKSYKVMLDPPDDARTAKSGDATPNPAAGKNRHHRAFLFVMLGVGAAIGSLIKKFDDVESPDQP